MLAHRALEFEFAGLNETRPLPRVTEIRDPVLFDIRRDGWEERGLIAGSGHQGNVAGQDSIYLYAPLADYADEPRLVGSYFTQDAIATQFQRLAQAALAGLFGLVLAVAAAFLFGRVLRGPGGPGAVGRARESSGPRRPGGARRARHRAGDPRGQCQAHAAGQDAHRHTQRPGGGGQPWHVDPHELYGRRRYREYRATPGESGGR